MSNHIQLKINSEIYELLQILGEDYINKIPKEIYSNIRENKDENYIPRYSKDIPIYEQKLDKKTVAFLCMLHYNYWCESEKEKQQIEKILNYNQKLKIKKYDKYRERFKNNKSEEKTKDKENNKLISVKSGIIEKVKMYLKWIIK